MNRILSWLGSHGSAITAMASMAIALTSLYLGFQAQKEDRDYREMMIKPSLGIKANTKDFSVGFANQGLGPADVKDVMYHLGGKCLSMLDSDKQISRKNYYSIEDDLRVRFFDDILLPLFASSELPNIATHQQMVLPGSIIGPGQTITIFGLDEASTNAVHQKFDALRVEQANSLRKRFTVQALTLPFYMRFCSMSGRYCETTIHDDENAERCSFK